MFVWVLVLVFGITASCVKFEPAGFLFVSTDSIHVEAGEQGIYTLAGSIVNIGEEEIEQHGFCWSEFEDPVLYDDSISLGQAETKGSFHSTIDGLVALNTYHVRAYAITPKEIFYGNEKVFTASELVVPTVRTYQVQHFDRHSATCYGYVVLEGSAPVTERGMCWSTSRKPKVEDGHKSDEEGGLGPFNLELAGLRENTVYYVRAYARNSRGVAYGAEFSFKTLAENEISDFDGNIYSTIVIGEQTWMRTNLRVTHYSDGTPIPHVEDADEWSRLTHESKAYSWYNNEEHYAVAYGALYTWPAVMNGTEGSRENPGGIQGVCPDGWHVPSDLEWQEMEIYLGMDPAMADTMLFRSRGEDIGGKFKETGFTHWRSPNTGATNLSGFAAVGGGLRNAYGQFRNLNRDGKYWTATLYKETQGPLARGLSFSNTYIDRDYEHNFNAASVRCVKDDE